MLDGGGAADQGHADLRENHGMGVSGFCQIDGLILEIARVRNAQASL